MQQRRSWPSDTLSSPIDRQRSALLHRNKKRHPHPMAIQTPRQRLANEKWAKRNEKKVGKPKTKAKDQPSKSPISKPWVIALVFLLIGGGILELVSLLLWCGQLLNKPEIVCISSAKRPKMKELGTKKKTQSRDVTWLSSISHISQLFTCNLPLSISVSYINYNATS